MKTSFCWYKAIIRLGVAHKLIGNALPISARVCKVKLAINLVHTGKISCLCLLSKCLFAVFMVFRASIRQYILDLLPNRLCQLLQISAKHCRLVSVPPLNFTITFMHLQIILESAFKWNDSVLKAVFVLLKAAYSLWNDVMVMTVYIYLNLCLISLITTHKHK